MFDSVQTYLSNLKSNVEDLINQNYTEMTVESSAALSRSVLQEVLYSLGMAAIDQIDEYDYEPLKKRFSEMLSDPRHIRIRGDNVTVKFDELVAGNLLDLEMGQEAAGGHTMKPAAPFFWKYGIYLPGREGVEPTSKAVRDWIDKTGITYEEVMAERLQFWEQQGTAPYWYLINYGTASWDSGGRAYPSFSGTHFVEQFRSIADRVLQQSRALYVSRLAESLGATAERLVKEPRTGTTVTIIRIPIPSSRKGKTLSIQTSSSGNYFYRLGSTDMITFQEAVKLIRRQYPQ